MGIYNDRILPYLIHFSMRRRDLAEYRGRVVPAAEGRVLEIGIGSGLNLPFYTAKVEHVIGLDPSPKLLAMTREAASRESSVPVELVEASAETIPLSAASVDTVVTTWTMCSIPDVRRAVDEMRRVLKPGGRLLFVEHGRAPEQRVRWWQDKLTLAWKRFSGGCHLNRPVANLIADGGFRIERLDTGYLRGPKALAFLYEGSARPQ